MKGIVPVDDLPHQKLASNQRVVIKSQKRVDMGPFVRFSCWHCADAPCIQRCPFNAVSKSPTSGAVWTDPNLCNPDDPRCVQQCKIDCQRGGIHYIGAGSDLWSGSKSWKCTLCTGTYENAPYVGAGAGGDLPSKGLRTTVGPVTTWYSTLYPTREVPEIEHQPSCVFTCPANAMVYDTRANILEYIQDPANGFVGRFGDGSMFWASKVELSPPKADPFMEDHVSPMVGSLLSSPFAKAALAPTLVIGGLLALSARRAKMEQEVSMAGEEL